MCLCCVCPRVSLCLFRLWLFYVYVLIWLKILAVGRLDFISILKLAVNWMWPNVSSLPQLLLNITTRLKTNPARPASLLLRILSFFALHRLLERVPLSMA